MLDPSFSFLRVPGTYSHSSHFCMLLILSSGAFLHDVQKKKGASTLLKKDGGFPKRRFPWCFLRKLPTPMFSIEGFEIFEPWEVQQLWQGRRKVSGSIEIFCWLYYILATRDQLSHFWTKVGCRNAMSYTIFIKQGLMRSLFWIILQLFAQPL